MVDEFDELDFRDLEKDLARKRYKPGNETHVEKLVNRLLAAKGYAQESNQDLIQQVWSKLVGEQFAKKTLCGLVKRGKLTVFMANSLVMTELTFQKQTLLLGLQKELPHFKIQELIFRIGKI